MPRELSRGPGEWPTPQQMEMEVIDGLPSLRAAIHHQPISVMESQLGRESARREDQMPHQRLVRFLQVGQRRDRLFGDDEDVGRGLGGDVTEGEAEFVFVDDVGGNFFAEYFAK